MGSFKTDEEFLGLKWDHVAFCILLHRTTENPEKVGGLLHVTVKAQAAYTIPSGPKSQQGTWGHQVRADGDWGF